MNSDKLSKHIHSFWDNEIIPTLVEYIKIPNKSPSFDPDWEKHGHMNRVLELAVNWTEVNKPDGSVITVKNSPGRTPLLLLDIPGTKEGNILMYGHLDKQPEMEGWNDGLGPWKPVIKDEKLYDKIWQAYAALLPVKTVGVMGDNRTYEYLCLLRAITSEDGMTADFFEFKKSFMQYVSNQIINNIRGINRVVYDITSKPPSTIELE